MKKNQLYFWKLKTLAVCSTQYNQKITKKFMYY